MALFSETHDFLLEIEIIDYLVWTVVPGTAAS